MKQGQVYFFTLETLLLLFIVVASAVATGPFEHVYSMWIDDNNKTA